MDRSYSINIEIDDVSFVDINEAQIENIRNKLEEYKKNIRYKNYFRCRKDTY